MRGTRASRSDGDSGSLALGMGQPGASLAEKAFGLFEVDPGVEGATQEYRGVTKIREPS